MRMLRWMYGHTRLDRIRTEDIRKMVGVEPIEVKMSESRLRWFGHIQCCSVDAPVRRDILYQEKYVRRGRGTPRLSREKVVQGDMQERNIMESLTNR